MARLDDDRFTRITFDFEGVGNKPRRNKLLRLSSEEKIGLPLSLVNPNIKPQPAVNPVKKIPGPKHCYYCEIKIFPYEPGLKPEVLLTEDHIIPRSKGGSGSFANKVNSCPKCNSLKSNLELEQFIRAIIISNRFSPTKKEKIITKVRELIAYRNENIYKMTNSAKTLDYYISTSETDDYNSRR